MTAESQRYPLPFTPVACFFISVEKGRAERNGERESKTTLGSENKNQTNKEKKRKMKIRFEIKKNYFYIFVYKSHLVASQWRQFSVLSEFHSLALANVWFNFFFQSSSTRHICSFFIFSDSFKPAFSSGSWSCICVSTLNVLGSDPHEAKHTEPGRAEELGTRSRVAACGPPAPGPPLAPKLCLETAWGHSSWHWPKLCCNRVTPTALQ